MLERYTMPHMAHLWSLQHKYEVWQRIEVFVCEYWFQNGKIPVKDWDSIRQKASFDINRVAEIEAEIHHDLLAFLTNLAENIGESSRYVHLGLTSSDVVDTATSYILFEASSFILDASKSLLDSLRVQSDKYKYAIMVGRTHGVHAEPMTLGLKLLGFYAEVFRNHQRLKEAFENVFYGKISGAVGTYSQIPMELEEFVLKRLGLNKEPISAQVVPRDRHAHLLNVIALVGQGLYRLAQEIRLLQKTESGEVAEPFYQRQKGSSAMPHKKNPILCERVCGLARVLLGYSTSGMQNIPLWHERDISHSSAERMLLPDALSTIEYMYLTMNKVIKNLFVSQKNMDDVFNKTKGLLYSSRALLCITEELKITREEAYAIVQNLAMRVWKNPEKYHLRQLLEQHELLTKISSDKWDRVFDTQDFLKNTDHIFTSVYDSYR